MLCYAISCYIMLCRQAAFAAAYQQTLMQQQMQHAAMQTALGRHHREMSAPANQHTWDLRNCFFVPPWHLGVIILFVSPVWVSIVHVTVLLSFHLAVFSTAQGNLHDLSNLTSELWNIHLNFESAVRWEEIDLVSSIAYSPHELSLRRPCGNRA